MRLNNIATPVIAWMAATLLLGESVGRNDSVQIGFEEAVRAYLDVVPGKLTRSGVVVAGRRYYSATPEFAQALDSVSGGQKVDICVFILSACIRHVWFDWKNKLVELDVRYPVAVSNIVKYMSFTEAMEYSEHIENWEAKERKHRPAKRQLIRDDFSEQTGLELKSGRRVAGRPKRGSATSRQEEIEARQSVEGRKVA